MSQLFTSGSHGTGASASTSELPMSIQGWFAYGAVILGWSSKQAAHILTLLTILFFKELNLSYKPGQGTQETQSRSLSWEDPLEEEMATHRSVLAWKFPWAEEPGGLQSVGLQRVRHNWVTGHPAHAHIRSLYTSTQPPFPVLSIPLRKFWGPFCIRFFLPPGPPFIFFIVWLCRSQILSAFACRNKSLFCLHFWNIFFAAYRVESWAFFFQRLEMFPYYHLAGLVSDEKPAFTLLLVICIYYLLFLWLRPRLSRYHCF